MRLAVCCLATLSLAAGDAALWAELPQWPIGIGPIGVDAPQPNNRRGPKARILAWIPDGVDQPRAMILTVNNSDLKDMAQDAALRAVAARHRCAVVYVRDRVPARSGDGAAQFTPAEDPAQDYRLVALRDLAELTGRSAFQHAPWVLIAKSSVGHHAIQTAWRWPERTIASVIYHGETMPWPPPPAAAPAASAATILHLQLNGETEWGGTWFRHVRPALMSYRERTAWLPHLLVGRGLGHGDYIDVSGSKDFGKPFPGVVTTRASWDYIAAFIDRALTLRLPATGGAEAGPLALRPVDPAGGVLIDPFATEELWRQPPFPLDRGPNGYTHPPEPAFTGYARIAAATAPLPAGLPVGAVPLGRSAPAWLVTNHLPKLWSKDPMRELGGLESTWPGTGTSIDLDGTPLTFQPATPEQIGPNGGLKLPRFPLTIAGATAFELSASGAYLVRAPFSMAGRLQVVINGVPVDHRQVIELDPGRYVMLALLRLNAGWGTLEPWLEPVDAPTLAAAHALGDERARRMAEQRRLAATPPRADDRLIRAWAEVPAEERARMLWLPDRELARMWLDYTRLAAAPVR